MARPLVSIVVPTYNRASLACRAIESALAQTWPNVEVVVVDDGSTDDTQAALTAYASDPRVVRVRHDRNQGATQAKNTGLDRLTGEFATILDSDDTLVPDAVDRLMREFARLGDAYGMVFANCVDATSGAWTGRGLTEAGDVTFADAITGRFQGEFWGIWRTAVLGARRFDPRVNGGEALVWHDLYRSTRVSYVHEALRRYERGGTDRVSKQQLAPDQLARTRLIYELYLERFGADMRRVAPYAYARQLQAIGAWHIVAGERRAGVARLLESIRSGASLAQMAQAAVLAVMPRRLLWRLLERRRG